MVKIAKKLLVDNSGDENIAKMIWVAIAFIVGAILLVLIDSTFNGPIHDWYDRVVKSWFDGEGFNGQFPGYSVNPVTPYSGDSLSGVDPTPGGMGFDGPTHLLNP